MKPAHGHWRYFHSTEKYIFIHSYSPNLCHPFTPLTSPEERINSGDAWRADSNPAFVVVNSFHPSRPPCPRADICKFAALSSWVCLHLMPCRPPVPSIVSGTLLLVYASAMWALTVAKSPCSLVACLAAVCCFLFHLTIWFSIFNTGQTQQENQISVPLGFLPAPPDGHSKQP